MCWNREAVQVGQMKPLTLYPHESRGLAAGTLGMIWRPVTPEEAWLSGEGDWLGDPVGQFKETWSQRFPRYPWSENPWSENPWAWGVEIKRA